ncbi:hypothetical protein ABC347_05200 [Sphingomonas sp. 1P06PA]|uniref:hypothetical protein n=1 Tax=Sphingomonas sp. 1P06PA TaxID=554121 RepID=UPI0039A515E8
MLDERLIIAIGRIERALSRIETAAQRSAPADPGLAARHAALRRDTAAAIARLDALIGD